MKKIVSIIAVVLVAACMFVGCGSSSGSKTKEIDSKELFESLKSLEFSDEMQDLDSMIVSMYFDIDEDVTAYAYKSKSYTADIIAVFESKNSTVAKETRKKITEYLADSEEEFTKYSADEATRLKSAYVFNKGKYSVLVICNNIDDAKSIVEAAFE